MGGEGGGGGGGLGGGPRGKGGGPERLRSQNQKRGFFRFFFGVVLGVGEYGRGCDGAL